MATGGLYGSSTANISVALSGAESNGLYGNNTNFGGTYFEWFVFQVSASQPATPTGGSWDFTTNVGTAPSGWLNAPTSNPTNPVWVSIGIVNSRSTSSITWSTPGVFSYSGQLNGSGVPTSGTGLDGEFYIQTGVSPYAIWFKNTGTWVQVTGAALYVALTGDQTIGGTKTFSSVIQGSISGNAATATSATTAATATYATTAGSATTSGTATYATSAGSVPYSGLTGTVPTWNQNTTGNAATADYATNAGYATNANAAVVAGNVTGIVAIANGGTGASDATTARTNLGLGTAAVRNAAVALGVATLDAGGTVPLSQIPASLQGGVSYQGTWNATTNSPTLTSSVGTKGYYYVVNVAGSTNLNGITDWQVGDWAIFNGTVWEKIDNTDAVTSVNGYTGTVVLNANDVGALSDVTSTDGSVTITTPSTGVRDLSVAISGSTTNVLCLVRNTTGSTLTKGTVVYISGATGQNPTVSKAIATSDATSAQTLGMMTADLANNSNGYVTVIGLITNVDTSAYTDGQQLYLSGTTAGAVTGTKPSAPTHLVYVAVVEHAHPTQGKLFVKVQNGYELDEIHDVQIVSPTTGQTLVYDSSTSLWENSNAPVISGTTIDNTVIGGTTPAAATFTTLTATTANIQAAGANAGLTMVRNSDVSGNSTRIFLDSSGGVSAIYNSGNTIRFHTAAVIGTTSGALQFNVAHTASAVNYVQVTGAATTVFPTISAQGSDTNIGLTFASKGTQAVRFNTNTTDQQFRIAHTGSTSNYVQVTGSVAGSAPILSSQGSDTNISQVFQSKGTGAIDLAAGSSGVNISNGGTVTAITRTANGSGYTSLPTIAITAPTTAGGVQATASANLFANTATVASGGTGYTNGDVLTVVGGTPNGSAATYTVTGVSAGAVTSVSPLNFGSYSALPTNPVSVTGGTGSSATLNLTYGISTPTITNAGSGYVEQPTVSFSGGGGSGAAAYATVGATTTFKSIGHTGTVAMRFDTPSSLTNNIPTFRLIDSANAQDSGVQVLGGVGGAVINAFGSTNATLAIHASGTGFVRLGSGGTSQTEQLRVSHTASAVNYVQVTGAATTAAPSVIAQGSDSFIGLNVQSKSATLSLGTRVGGNPTLQVVDSGASPTNYFRMTGAATTVAPVLSAQGSDTNIGFVLQPKGTGALQAQQTDSTATGGNARGANAVDWQTSRSAASQVASAISTVIGGGSGNTASGFNASVVGGASNIASNNYAFVGGGLSNNAGLGMSGIAAGYSNQALGYLNSISGGYANSGTSGSAVTTQSATMNGTTAVTLSGSNANIKVGQLIIGTSINSFPYTYVAAISGTSLTLSQAASGSSTSTLSFYTPHGVVVGGGNNQATGSYSFIGGGGDAGTTANRNVASGDWSVVVGGTKNTASGISSFVGGGGSYGSGFSGNTASGTSAFAGAGYLNNASGFSGVVVGGNGNTQSLNAGFIGGGSNNSANSNNSVIAGGAYGTSRSVDGYAVFPAHNNPIASASGVSQGALVILGVQTTDATATVLRSNTSSATTTNQVILPNNSAYYFKGTVVAGVTGAGNTKGWTVEGVIKRGANAASTAIVGSATVTSSYADAGASTWALTATADTTNGGLAITFTGQAATTIRCVAKIETTEMTY